MLLDDDVEVGAAEPEGAHAAAAHVVRRLPPRAAGSVLTANGRVSQSTLGLGFAKFRLGGELLRRAATRTILNSPAAPAAALRWPMFDFTEPSAIERGAAPAAPKTAVRLASSEASPTRVEVPWASTAPGRGGVDPGALPGALDRELLAHGVGRGDALALAVGGAADAEDDGVDAVAVALGVLEPLEHEQGGALAHDEPVGPGVERPGAGGRERADLAELHERVHAHVAVQAAGDDGVELVVGEAGDGRVERGQARGAGGVGGEVHPTQVEQVRDPAGDDVRELAGHGVLGDR